MSDLDEVISIGPYALGDEHEILRVFKKVFQVERSLPAWHWQYTKNPAGLHAFLAKTESGRVISQFTGVPRVVRIAGRNVIFSEIVDSFTDPDHRQGLKKPGWFASTCYAFVDHFGRPDREIIMYGLPNPPAYRVGSRLLGYEHFYKLELLSRPLESLTETSNLNASSSVTEIETFEPEWDKHFEDLSKAYGALTVRDHRYLNWRYVQRPDAQYRVLALRDGTNNPRGFAVLRHAWLGQPTTAVAECFCDPADPLARDLLKAIEVAAREAGDHKVQFMVAPQSREWMALTGIGYTPELSQFRLV
ncbi:MAG TPA: GNAT family N-acetyltransferase, partial [Planctomycetota bacterium]|nr:GNAT family N-acetyltransferase [Planctomycetota bacterium]